MSLSAADKEKLRAYTKPSFEKSSLAVPLVVGGLLVGAIFGGRHLLRSIRGYQAKPENAMNIARKYYDGGFEKKMNRREAALILGCRESSSKEKIMSRYRVLMKLNHPDLGGSKFLAMKVNDAKELLYNRARSDKDV